MMLCNRLTCDDHQLGYTLLREETETLISVSFEKSGDSIDGIYGDVFVYGSSGETCHHVTFSTLQELETLLPGVGVEGQVDLHLIALCAYRVVATYTRFSRIQDTSVKSLSPYLDNLPSAR